MIPVILCLLLATVEAKLVISPDHQEQIFDTFLSDGLNVLQNVADEMTKFLDETNLHHNEMETHMKRKLFYHPSLNNEHLKNMDPEILDKEAEKVVHNIVYHLYDSWDEMMEPIRDAFAPYEHMISALTNYNYADPIARSRPHVELPANETVKGMIHGMKSFPEALSRVKNLMKLTNNRLATNDLDDIDYPMVQAKVMERIHQANERLQFV